MTDREIGLVPEQDARAEAVRVDAGDVGDVVAVLLEPVDRGIVGAEQVVLRPGRCAAEVSGCERPVVGDREGAVRG